MAVTVLSIKSKETMNKQHLNQMVQWDDGELSEQDTIKLFQELVDSGDCYVLGGAYSKQAQIMINKGLIKKADKSKITKMCKTLLMLF